MSCSEKSALGVLLTLENFLLEQVKDDLPLLALQLKSPLTFLPLSTESFAFQSDFAPLDLELFPAERHLLFT